MKKKIIYGLLFAVAMVTASSSFVSCKDYEGDDVQELKEQNARLQDYLQKQIDAIKQCNCDPTLAARLAAIESDYLKAAALSGYATQDWVNQQGFTTLGDVQNWVNQQGFSTLTMEAVQNWVNQQGFSTSSGLTEEDVQNIVMNNLINQIQLHILGENNKLISDMITGALANGENPYWTKDDVINYFNSNKQDLTGYATKDEINALRNYILLGDSVKNAYTWASYCYQYIKAQGDSLKGAYDSIGVVRQEAYKNYQNAKHLADSAIVLANQALDSANAALVRISDLETAMKAADNKLQAQIDTLKSKVDNNAKMIGNIVGTLKKQITGVIVQGAYSPVLGSGTLPIGVQTNVLAAYVGINKTGRDVRFPSYISGDYANGEAALTGEDYDYLTSLGLWPNELTINSGDYILSDNADNAGTLYLTVNPTNIDFAGTDFKLVNSQGDQAKVQLSALNKSQEVMTFGWTRSGVESASANGFYEVKANINRNDVKDMQPAIDRKKLQKAFKENFVQDPARGQIKYLAVLDMIRAIYNSLEPLERFGVQATWNDPVVGKRSFTSAFDIAATVISPLGFGFTIPDNRYTRLPIFNVEYIKTKLRLKRLDTLKVKDGKIIADGVDESGNTVQVDVTDLYEELYGGFNAAYTKALNDANKRIDYFVNFLNRYNHYASKIDAAILNANYILQPVLLWTDGENAGELGGVVCPDFTKGTQVKAGSSIGIVPTSYSLELLAPAYKKNVVVTNVYMIDPATGVQVTAQGAHDRNGMETALKEINAAINSTALSESLSIKNPFIIDVKPEYVGMTFEFTYTAIDYTGQIAGRKFYLTVVE